MTAFVEHQFSKGFILDEERIRRINEILISRGKEFSPDIHPSYEVFRADSLKYSTQDIQDIINEKNTEYQKITQIKINLDKEKDLSLELSFNAEGETDLVITGDDRDKVFILFSDLREYLNNEVCTIRLWFEKINYRNLVPIMGLMMMGALLFLFMPLIKDLRVPEPNIETLLASQNISEKLNYLIESKGKEQELFSSTTLLIVVLALFYMSFVIPSIIKLIRKIFPTHLFCLEKRSKETRNGNKI